MAVIEYTAKRSLATGHVANEAYSIELELLDATSQISDIKDERRSPGGGLEVTFDRQDIEWTLQLGPVRGFELELLREFLDSSESGELIRVWLWQEDAAPLLLKRMDSSHAESTFMRCGAENLDYFTGQFTALQVAPYDPSGGGAGSMDAGAFGGGGAGGNTTDIYDPDIGGPDGGLNPEPVIHIDGSAAMTTAAGNELGYQAYFDRGFGIGSLDYNHITGSPATYDIVRFGVNNSSGDSTVVLLELEVSGFDGELLSSAIGTLAIDTPGGQSIPNFLGSDAEFFEWSAGIATWQWRFLDTFDPDPADLGGYSLFLTA